MEALVVWDKAIDHENLEVVWKLHHTKHHAGTPDELRFFRVMRDGAKHFFHSPEAYLEFVGGIETLDPESVENVRGAMRAWRARLQRLKGGGA